MPDKKKKKQPAEPMGELIANFRERVQKPAPQVGQGDDTPTPAQAAIWRAASQAELFPDAVDILTPELNIARHFDFLFCSPRSKRVADFRERRIETSGEFVAVAPALVVSFDGNQTVTDSRTPTVTSGRYFYAMLQLWEEQGRRPDGWIVFSGYELFKILKLRAGKQSYQRLYRELSVLKGSVIHWHQTFRAGVDDIKTSEELNLLSYYKNKETTTHVAPHISSIEERTVVQIHPTIAAGLIAGNVKPFMFREYLAISEKSYDAAILYTKLDLYLSGAKRVWRRKVSGLLEDLGIESKRYSLSAKRREKALELAEVLNQRRISRGKLKVTVVDGAEELLLRAERLPVREPRTWNVCENLGPESVGFLVGEMEKWVGFPTDKRGLLTRYAKAYPEAVILDTLSRFRADAMKDSKVRNKAGVFTAYLHREVHRKELHWIGKCAGRACKYQKDLLD